MSREAENPPTEAPHRTRRQLGVSCAQAKVPGLGSCECASAHPLEKRIRLVTLHLASARVDKIAAQRQWMKAVRALQQHTLDRAMHHAGQPSAPHTQALG